MEKYKHLVQYYETDKMGVTHHSNYIRFMEEARLDFFKKIGYDYLDFEKQGFFSPVIGLSNVKYKKTSTVGDEIEIETSVKEYNGFKIIMHYVMKIDGKTIFEGDSEHCFLTSEMKIIRVSDKNFPAFHNKMLELVNNKT